MASMVAKACGSASNHMPAVTVQEKGSRNKRKFRADPPSVDPNKIIPLPPNECSSFEFSAEKFETIPNHRHSNGCGICGANQDSSNALKLDLGLSCAAVTSKVEANRPRDEIETSFDNHHDADWSDLTESQLEELVLNNLDSIFKSAIKRIIASGYSEEVVTKAILRSGLCYGCKDTVSNIVDNTLAFLRSGQDIDQSREHYFENLQQMKKYVLAELVCLLKEVRPFFSTGDAMWCLLICDMNVSHACAVDSDPFSSFPADASSNGHSIISGQSQSRPEPKSFESNIKIPCRQSLSSAYDHNCPSELPPNLASFYDGHCLRSEATHVENNANLKPKTPFVLYGLVPEKESQNSSFVLDGPVLQTESQNSITITNKNPFTVAGTCNTTVAEEKFVGSRKSPGLTKRECVLRQKSIHFEKHYRAYGSKGTSRAGKHSSFGGLVLDKKLKAVADSTGLNAKNASFKHNKVMGFDAPQDCTNSNLSLGTELSSVPTFGLETVDNNLPLPKSSISSSLPVVPVNTSPSLPVADTELSLSLPTKSIANPMPISFNIKSPHYCCGGISNVKSLGQWVPHDRKDETIMKLAPRVRELQNQLQEWTEWANQKVMQAARRLSKDKAELKTLRLDKEEVERLKKEKQILEENTMKKLSEMENALSKASGQVERANAAVRRLGVENAALRREMEAATIRAVESAASCQEVSKREKKTLLKYQSWEKQKSIFQEELSTEKHELLQVQQELQQAKDAWNQVQAKLNQEEKAKDEILTQVNSLRKEREDVEVSVNSKQDIMKSKAENNLQKYKDNIERLEKEIYQLRLKTDSSKIAALRRGIDGSYASKLTDFGKTLSLKDSARSYVSRTVTSTYFQDFTGNGGVKRERECVMCLSEEMSVVFLPCAHQVVCKMCNELHEKQGMKDCPSCRSPILQRVCVRYTRS